jgi:hypothetical protein
VRFFEGAEGLRAIREEILATDAQDMRVAIEFRNISSVLSPEENAEHDRRVAEKGIRGRLLCTGAHSLDELRKHHPHFEFRSLTADRFPISGELTVFGNKIFAFTEHGKLIGVAIESEELTKTLRAMFDLAWLGAGAQPGAAAPRPPAASPPVTPAH